MFESVWGVTFLVCVFLFGVLLVFVGVPAPQGGGRMSYMFELLRMCGSFSGVCVCVFVGACVCLLRGGHAIHV